MEQNHQNLHRILRASYQAGRLAIRLSADGYPRLAGDEHRKQSPVPTPTPERAPREPGEPADLGEQWHH